MQILSIFRMLCHPRHDLALGELGIVLLDVPALGMLQKLITLVHFDAQAVQSGNHFGCVGNDGVLTVWKLGEIVTDDFVVQREFHFLGIHQDKLQLRRMPAVQHAHKHGVQAHRLSLTCGTGHEQVRHLGHVKHVRFVADGFAQRNGEFSFGILELLAGNEGSHADHVRA